VKHRPGKEHQNADSMSRPPIALAEVNALTVKAEQQFDPFTAVVKKLLLKEDTSDEDQEMVVLARRHTAKMKVIKGMLTRSYTDPNTQIQYSPAVLPRHMRNEALRLVHDEMAHAGVKKTFAMMIARVWWPHMHSDISKWIAACKECQWVTTPPRRNVKLMPIGCTRKFQMWAMDVKGPLPRSKEKYRFLLVLIDMYSRWVEAFALKNYTTVIIKEIVDREIVARFGVPEAVLTDQGSSFISGPATDYFTKLGVEQRKTKRFYPQCNGMVERWNRSVGDYFQKKCNLKGNDWPDFLQFFLRAYRMQPNRMTGTSPYKIVFGTQPRTPIEEAFELPTITKFFGTRGVDEKLKVYRDDMKERFDKNVIEVLFQVGQKVLWRDKERQRQRGKPQRKTARKWFGPYRIERIENRLLIKLENVEALVRASRLKLYKERTKVRRRAFRLRRKSVIAKKKKLKELKKGVRVKIFWEGENKIFRGTLGRFSRRQGMWKVMYDDGHDIYELPEHIAQKGETFHR